MAERKVVCIQYRTGGTVKRNGRSYPETKLLTVGSAFLTEPSDENGSRWMAQGSMRAIPPQWDGKFILLDPLPRGGEGEMDSIQENL